MIGIVVAIPVAVEAKQIGVEILQYEDDDDEEFRR